MLYHYAKDFYIFDINQPNMKQLLFFLTFFSFIVLGSAQKRQAAEPLQYPFDETGTEVSRGVFGADDRKEVKDAEGIEDFVRATAVMIPKANIVGNKVYGRTLRERLTDQFGSSNFDSNVKFLDQPTAASCTGFLIAPDILVTAGHCIEELEDASDYVWVFNYTNELKHNKYRGYVEIDPKDVYEVSEVLGAYFQNLSTKTDYSVLKLDRKSNRTPYRFRTSGKVSDWGDVSTIGSPTGLPLKYSDNSYVVNNSPNKWFRNNIDSFPGNSGGPVFNNNGFIEGILVRGAVELRDGRYTGDYAYDENCNCITTVNWSSVSGTAGCEAHRITSIPKDLLHRAIYENIEYAIKNNLSNRLNAWLAYSWILDHDYTQTKERFEFIAARNGNLEALKKIMAKTTTMVLDEDNRNLLFYATYFENTEMVEFLIGEGLLIDEKDKYSETPLQFAINNDKGAAAVILMDSEPDLFVKNNAGDNLLHSSARQGYISFVKYLISKGVDAGAKNQKGQRPEDIAKSLKYKQIRKMLKKARKRG